MARKYLLTCLLIIAGATGVSAQHVITGTVLDELNQPLMGATITVQGNKDLGITTDVDGRYKLVVPQSSTITLNVSFIGYTTLSERFHPKANNVKNFTMREDENFLDEVVVTGTRTPKLLKDVPIVTRVITAEDIKKVDATNIGELLQSELPGIEFTYSMNQQVNVNMQGFGGNSVLFLVDGERVAGETLDNIDYSRLNLDNVERIEIVKGAASSLYGSNAVGGVVNLISKTSTDLWGVNVNSFWGAHGEHRYGGSASVNKGKFNNVFNVQFNKSDAIDLKNDGDYGQIYGHKNWNFKDRLVFTPIKDLKFTGKLGYFFRERDSKPDMKERYRGYNGSLKGNYSFKKNNDLELSYIFDQYDKSDYGLASKLDIRDYSNVQNSVRTIYNHTFDKNNILTVGADYMHDYLMSYQFVDKGSYTQHTADVFAQFDWNVTKNFNVIAGARYDYFSESNIHHVSPKLGLMYKFSNFSLRGSYAGGFKAPTLKEMYMSFNMANIFMIYGNPDLDPESSHNFSVSAEYLKRNYNLTITGFYNLVDNRITTAWDNSLNGMRYSNMSKMNICGVDANASAKYASGFAWRISYAFTHEHVKNGGPNLSSTRPHTATARIEYTKDWKNYGFNIALNGRVLSKVTTDEYVDSGYEQTVEKTYPAYTMWKLSLMQHVWKGINVTMAVDNLFNYVPDYYYSNSPSTTGTTFCAGLSINIDQMFK